ncbi:DUF429 domain-containing protein [Ferrimonas balearica]|uniref:DUF429 domain-containing protein n=1 Tax=Ferrimonas balearica TaxID=44012 RepID=UPI001C99B376|nr:DUF429 domain-containing protein [Ferrimonas balearica]MBY5920942.1 DUF429 domain-containing protein [Ferrimonas balearica]MBY5996373.1 DUF429 domain-containing protein [Ferrimonas balearica]
MAWDVIAIGWDVGGWQGKKQAVAVAAWRRGDKAVTWLGISPAFSLSQRAPLSLDTLLSPAGVSVDVVAKAKQVTIGIDAPLAYPLAFKRLLAGEPVLDTAPQAEIDNPLAYRDCERWVHWTFGKKPMSPVFDRLGNNATVAMSALHALRRQGYSVLPQDADEAIRAVIEVYPALLKDAAESASPAKPMFRPFLPDPVPQTGDVYDAALAALVALGHGLCALGEEEALSLPCILGPAPGYVRDEGWVYALNCGKVISTHSHENATVAKHRDDSERGEWRGGSSASTQIGYVNCNAQRVGGTRGTPGTDHGQLAYRVICERCGCVYGVNGTSLFQCKCPTCQRGRADIPF